MKRIALVIILFFVTDFSFAKDVIIFDVANDQVYHSLDEYQQTDFQSNKMDEDDYVITFDIPAETREAKATELPNNESGRLSLPSVSVRSDGICSAVQDIPLGEDRIYDELVVFKGPIGCGQPGGNNDPFCQKMYYCLDGQVVNLGFSESNGKPWGLVSTALVTGNKLRSGDGRTPEGTFVIMDFDRSHSYAPQGFMRLNTRPVIGYNSGIAVHDISRDYWIGQRRSEGCVRTYSSDMRVLRTRLQIGDPVTIIGP